MHVGVVKVILTLSAYGVVAKFEVRVYLSRYLTLSIHLWGTRAQVEVLAHTQN